MEAKFLVFMRGTLKHGKLHGLVQLFGKASIAKDGPCSDRTEQGLAFIGRFENGLPVGPCWRGLFGGSWLYGIVDSKGEFTGENIAFIYPDLELAMTGEFQNGFMVSKSVKLA